MTKIRPCLLAGSSCFLAAIRYQTTHLSECIYELTGVMYSHTRIRALSFSLSLAHTKAFWSNWHRRRIGERSHLILGGFDGIPLIYFHLLEGCISGRSEAMRMGNRRRDLILMISISFCTSGT